MTDEFESSIRYEFTDQTSQSILGQSPMGNFEYSFQTPWRASLGMGHASPKFGFITAEIEFVDYTSGSFDLTVNSDNVGDQQYENELNSNIETQLQSAINVRLGIEYLLDNLRLRAGYNSYGSPYVDSDQGGSSISAGIGYVKGKFSIDMGLRYYDIEERSLIYDSVTNRQSDVNTELQQFTMILTAGTKF